LDSDPREETDLSTREPERVEKMRASWEKWRKETVPAPTQG
jgi:hypothetical protein